MISARITKSLLLWGLALFTVPWSVAQQIQNSSPPSTTEKLEFEVVSIKPTGPNPRGATGFGPIGFTSVNAPLLGIVSMAYFPQPVKGNQVVGYPAWTLNERYDIVAKIDEADAAAWSKLTPRQKQEPGRLMLQKVLAERCKLVVHLVPSTVDGYSVTIAKRGMQLHLAEPSETYPEGVKKLSEEGAKIIRESPENGNKMRFFNTSLQELLEQLGNMRGVMIRDDTGLTGRYDFELPSLVTPESKQDASASQLPPTPSELWDFAAIGLTIKPAKLPSQNLVIDHIERPTEN